MTMSGHEEMPAAARAEVDATDDHGLSRRTALRTAAAAGLAGAALAATGAPALAAARPGRADHNEAGHNEAGHDEAGHEAHDGEPIVAHLRDARTGEIDVFHGTSQTRLHDKTLAAALIRASR